MKSSILQIPKQQSQVKRKSSKSSSLKLPALFTFDINIEASDEPEAKGQETEKQEEPTWHFFPRAFSEHTQNSQTKCSTKLIESMAPSLLEANMSTTFWDLSRHFESDSLFYPLPDSSQGPGGSG